MGTIEFRLKNGLTPTEIEKINQTTDKIFAAENITCIHNDSVKRIYGDQSGKVNLGMVGAALCEIADNKDIVNALAKATWIMPDETSDLMEDFFNN